MPTASLDSHRARATHADSVLDGTVRHAPLQSLWLTAMLAGAVTGALFFFSWTGLLLFVSSTAIVLLFGHSLGSHRKLIHDSYCMPPLAGIPAGVPGRAGGTQRPAGPAAPARTARLCPAPARLPPLPAPRRRLLARCLVATALPPAPRPSAAHRHRAAHRARPLLPFSGSNMDAAATAVGPAVLRLGRLGLGLLGCLRPSQRRRAGPLADRLLCPQPWANAFSCRWRRRARQKYPPGRRC